MVGLIAELGDFKGRASGWGLERVLILALALAWTPKVCRITAFWALSSGVGHGAATTAQAKRYVRSNLYQPY